MWFCFKNQDPALCGHRALQIPYRPLAICGSEAENSVVIRDRVSASVAVAGEDPQRAVGRLGRGAQTTELAREQRLRCARAAPAVERHPPQALAPERGDVEAVPDDGRAARRCLLCDFKEGPAYPVPKASQ